LLLVAAALVLKLVNQDLQDLGVLELILCLHIQLELLHLLLVVEGVEVRPIVRLLRVVVQAAVVEHILLVQAKQELLIKDMQALVLLLGPVAAAEQVVLELLLLMMVAKVVQVS